MTMLAGEAYFAVWVAGSVWTWAVSARDLTSRSSTPPSGIENCGSDHGILLGIEQRTVSVPTSPAATATRPPASSVVSGATLGLVRHAVLSTTPTAETPALSEEERLERRRRFIERVFSQDGLDRDTLEHIEQLTDNEP
jgi:hypothetical protein